LSALSATGAKRGAQRRSAIGTESRHGIILGKILNAGCNCTSLGETVKEAIAIIDLERLWRFKTMHFGPPLPSNIYPVGLKTELDRPKVYTVKH